ncbi:acyl-CoA dehydrogenase family protein [Alicyclobacillus vulcanalis]|uniref:Acyl-CoA dehydrogenase n=2 Tax=Alicyclobacillus TaxID=29330 RepID=A0A1N7LJC4_9BACL|nr:acyl-CoA dehydrogenase family protein [Alicyclobacillus vulcanalis]SIS73907.1 Acyl-CoA dehydrogenase [Alicyclobacillus vulcanalis]
MRALSYAYGTNHFSQDVILQDILRHFWPQFEAHEPDLTRFGAIAGREVYETVYHVDHDAPPVLIHHDIDGRRIDRVRLSPSHLALLKALAFINRPPYEGGSWHHHFAYGYLIGDPGLYCVLTITNQVAYAIHKYAPEFADWKEALLSGRAFGATWMTEVHGGSDLGANQTTARPDGDTWRITGEKYFASGAGLTDYAITTARPAGAPSGPKGLALFLVPRLRKDGSLNFHVRRLKDKSATRAVPSGEVEFDETEAFLVGDAHLGIYYTLENLTVSRLANAAGAMGIAQKALLEVMHRVRHRRSFGHVLQDHALIRRDLTDFAVRHAGGLALTFQAIDLFDRSWHERPPYSANYHLARLYTHLAKTRTADHAAHLTAMAMELFGGIGFLEEYGIARWHREALITPIWEGPSNIQALDFLETLMKLGHGDDVIERITSPITRANAPGGADAASRLRQEVAALRTLPRTEAEWRAKFVLRMMADVAQAASLYQIAETAGERYEKLGHLYLTHFIGGQEYPSWALYDVSIWGWM